ncbi:DUF2239 family protein [Maritalea sp.]|uniref:DUF2239 family protein n=1 Tax=Maritalea sp. TaxID=2003361 RepID=UPI003EFA8565
MSYSPELECVAFVGHHLIAAGALAEVVNEVKRHHDRNPNELIHVFNGQDSSMIEIDLRGSVEDVFDRLFKKDVHAEDAVPPKRVGRPKLGVVSKEITLLPRHWDWLRQQRGGASVTLRKLVGEAMRVSDPNRDQRQLQSKTYGLMTAVAGDLPKFEEAARALFALDGDKFKAETSDWPSPLRDHLLKISKDLFTPNGEGGPKEMNHE